jgi:hypothetical protein
MSPITIGIDVVPIDNPVIPAGTGKKVSNSNSDGHRKEDPEREVRVEKRESLLLQTHLFRLADF